MSRASWVGALVALWFGAPAAAAPGVAGALDALAGLRGPLEAQGWSLATSRSSTVSPGDIYDPTDHQVQVLGAACFDLAGVRRGVAPSMEVDRALKGSGRVRFGLWGVGAGVDVDMDAQITDARVAEIAVAELAPSEACGRQLQALARAGADVGSWVVVQSTLTTDLDVRVCGGGEVGVSAVPAGEVSIGSESCRATHGASVVLALRPEPLSAVLAAARIPLPTLGAPAPAVSAKKAAKQRPCWVSAPCAPFVQPGYDVAVGHGATMGAADEAARQVLREPYDRLTRELPSQGLGDPPDLAALDAIAVAGRYRDDEGYHSLLVVDRAALQARLDADIDLARGALDAPVPADPVARARALASALPTARLLAWWEAERAVLLGDPVGGDAFAARVAQQKQAVAAVGVRPPAGPTAPSVTTALERAGVRVVAKDPADLVLGLTLAAPSTRAIQGFTHVTRAGVLELRSGDRLVGSVDVEASASSGDAGRATADAEAALQARVAELSVGLVREALGVEVRP